MYLISMNLPFPSNMKESEHLKGEIIKLSHKYIKALAKEKDNKMTGMNIFFLPQLSLYKTMENIWQTELTVILRFYPLQIVCILELLI